jgi:hypothetical protein
MYFQKFPTTFYSLDDRQSVQLITNLLLRVIVSQELKDNFSAYDEYDVQDGDTPEILAYKFYGDANLHWIILHVNEVLDPRFEWPLSTFNLQNFVDGKYTSLDGIHHYEDLDGNYVTGNLLLNFSALSNLFVTSSVVVNNSSFGKGYIIDKPSVNSIRVIATEGGFRTTDQIRLGSNSQITANITSVTVTSGIPVTNYNFEDEQNEARRRIRVLKPEFIESVIKEFESKLAEIDG